MTRDVDSLDSVFIAVLIVVAAATWALCECGRYFIQEVGCV